MTEQERDGLKEQVKYETEVFRAALLIAVATVGGTLSLLLGTPALLRAALAGAGILVSMVVVVGVWRQNQIIRALITRLQEDNA